MKPGRVTGARLQAAGGVVMLCVIAAYASLLPRARWQGDEYMVFSLLRDGGWAYYVHWYLTWSPRLVSNVLFGAYGLVVMALHRPLAGSCMAVLWAGLASACVAPAWLGGGGPAPRGARAGRMLVGLGLFALFLVGHSVTEVFYWPAGGLSYLPTLAGAVWLFWFLADGLGARIRRHAAAAAALFIVAGSSEVGIFAALSVALCVGAVQLRAPWRQWLWMLPGVAVALADLALVLHGRVGTIEVADYDPSVLHHAGAALLRAIPAFASNLVRPDLPGGAPLSAPLSVVSRVLIFAGARYTFGKTHEPGRVLAAFGAALLLAVFASLASAYFQFGQLCCARHDTMRACFITLAAAAFGAAWPHYRPNAGAAAWVAAVLLLFVPSAPSVIADYRSMDRAISARAQTWASGNAPGDSMVFIIDPAGRVMNGNGLAPGLVTDGSGIAWWQRGILEFFGKRNVLIKVAK